MIILNHHNTPIEIMDEKIIVNKILLLELKCKVWDSQWEFNRYAKNKGIPKYPNEIHNAYITIDDNDELVLHQYQGSLIPSKINHYSVEVFAANYKG